MVNPHTESQEEKAEIEHVDHSTDVVQDDAFYEGAPEPTLTLKVYLAMSAIVVLNFAQLFCLLGLNANGRFFAAIVGGADKTIWLGQSLATATAVLSPIFAKASDLWGRRWILVIAMTFGAIGSIIVSRCTSMNMAIVGSAIAGVSYGVQPLLFAVPAEIVPRKHRSAAIALANIAAGLGGISGILIGGALTEGGNADNIRIYFYITTGLFAFAAITTFLTYHPPVRPSQVQGSIVAKLRLMDWTGYTLFGIFLVLLNISLSWADNPYPWDSAHVLAPLCISIAFGLALIVHQVKFNKHDSMFDRRLFSTSRNAALGILLIWVDGLVFFVASSYLPQLLAVVYEPNEMLVSVRFSFLFLGSLPLMVLVGWYAGRYRDLRTPGVLGFIGFTIFGACLAAAKVDQSDAIWGYTVFACLGQAGTLIAVFAAAQFGSPAELIADLTALLISMRSFGGSVGLGVCSAIFNSESGKKIGPAVAKRVLPLGFPMTSLGPFIGAVSSFHFDQLSSIPGITPQIIQQGVLGFREGFLQAQRGLWILMAAFSFFAAVIFVFISNHKEQYSDSIDAPLAVREEEAVGTKTSA